MIIYIVQFCDLCNVLYKVINNFFKSKFLLWINLGLKWIGVQYKFNDWIIFMLMIYVLVFYIIEGMYVGIIFKL